MAIQVFHKNDRYTRFRADGGEGWPEKFDKVATVDLPDEQYAEVFYLTNSVDGPWWENPGVTAHTESDAFFEVEEHPGVKGTRSTSCGDIIVLSDGRVMECASFGWDLITPASTFDTPQEGLEAVLALTMQSLRAGSTRGGE